MKFNLFNSDGSKSGETEVKEFPVLEEGKGVDALRQYVLAYKANARQGNASTKTRDEVSGSGKKRSIDKRALALVVLVTSVQFKEPAVE